MKAFVIKFREEILSIALDEDTAWDVAGHDDDFTCVQVTITEVELIPPAVTDMERKALAGMQTTLAEVQSANRVLRDRLDALMDKLTLKPGSGGVRERFEQWFKMTYPLHERSSPSGFRDTTLKHSLWTAWQVADTCVRCWANEGEEVMNELPSAEDVERDNAAVQRYLDSMAPHVRERLQAEWLGKLLRHSQQYAALLRRLSGPKTGRTDALDTDLTQLSESMDADDYCAMLTLARTLEAELGLAREMERERCANAIPTNWLDPLLTGPSAIIGKKHDAVAIERLLRAIQGRIRPPPAPEQ